jgi:hypothetical protein
MVYEGVLALLYSEEAIGFYPSPIQGEYVLYMHFCEEPLINGRITYPLSRGVGISNLFYHNPSLYEEITTRKNLLYNDEVVFTFADLPEDVKSSIHRSYEKAQLATDSSEFL